MTWEIKWWFSEKIEGIGNVQTIQFIFVDLIIVVRVI